MTYNSKIILVNVSKSSDPVKVDNTIHFKVNDDVMVIPIDDTLKKFYEFSMVTDRTYGSDDDSYGVLISFRTRASDVDYTMYGFSYWEKDAHTALDHFLCLRKIIG